MDLLRANSQNLQGWVRLSFTPKSLFEDVSIVKKQLLEALGPTPVLIKNPFNLIQKKLETSAKQDSTTGDTIGFSEQLRKYAALKMSPSMSVKKPTKIQLLDYSICRPVPYLLHNYNLMNVKTPLSSLISIVPSDCSLLTEITDSLNYLATDLLKYHNNVLHFLINKLVSKSIAFDFINEYCRQLWNVTLRIQNNIETSDQNQQENIWKEQTFVLEFLFSILGTFLAASSMVFLPKRQAFIGYDSSLNEPMATLLEKDQYDEAQNKLVFPHLYYETCIRQLLFNFVFGSNPLKKLLIGESRFNTDVEQPCSMPSDFQDTKGHLQDIVYMCFNHALINRYYVETGPSEFIINSYNIRSFTVIEDPQPNGIILLCFKIRYTDGSIEVGDIILDGSHRCNWDECPLKKYDLQFYVEYSCNKIMDSVNQKLRFNAALNMAKIMPLIAACYRDLNVLEIETKEYVKNKKLPISSENIKPNTVPVIWLPRQKIIYDLPRLRVGTPLFQKAVEQLIPIKVMGHLRRCENPNSEQIALAKEFGITPPSGYTFVRPHSRLLDHIALKRFRSKSALLVLYGQEENTTGD